MLGRGTGSELRHPLGITIVGGLIVSQLLTLFTTPVIYLYFDRFERRVRAWGVEHAARRGGRRNEPVRALHPPPGRDHAADHRGRLRRASSPTPSCRWRRCRRWTSPTISVSASMAGASPDVMASTVATPLERHLGQIADVTEMTSSSATGSSRTSRCSSASTATSTARRATWRRRSTRRARTCRPRCAAIPTYRKVNTADAPIMILALTSDDPHAPGSSTTPPTRSCRRSCRR